MYRHFQRVMNKNKLFIITNKQVTEIITGLCKQNTVEAKKFLITDFLTCFFVLE